MKLERIRVGSFGILGNLDLDLGPGLTVVSGTNEAGKSTLAAFLPALLYGFPDGRSNLNQYPSLTPGRRGGSIEFLEGNSHYRAERWHDPGGRVSGNLVLYRDGVPIPNDEAQDTLEGLWGGLTQSTFRSLLSFGLSELEDIRSLEADRIASLLYSTAAGLDSRTLDRIAGDLARRQSVLYRPRASSTIGDALGDLEELAGEQPDQSTVARHAAKNDELAAERRRAEQLQEQVTRATARLRSSEALRAAAPLHERLEEIEFALSDLDVPEGFPEGGEERIGTIEATLSRLAEDEAALSEELDEVEREDESLQPGATDAMILQNGPQIEDLNERAQGIADTVSRRERIAHDIESTAKEMAALLAELGDKWTARRAESLIPSIELRQRVRRMSDESEEAADHHRGLLARRSELVRTRGEFSAAEAKIDPPSDDPREQMQILENMLQWEQMRERAAEHMERVENVISEDTPSTPTLSRWAPLWILLPALAAGGYFAFSNQVAPAVVTVLIGAIASGSLWIHLGRSASRPSGTGGLQTEIDRLRAEIEDLENRRADANHIVFDDDRQRSPEEIRTALETFREKEGERIRSEEVESRILRLDASIAFLDSEIESHREERDSLHNRHREALQAMGFPPGTESHEAARALEPLERYARARRQLRTLRSEAAGLDAKLLQFRRAVAHINPQTESPRQRTLDARDDLKAASTQLKDLRVRQDRRGQLETRGAELRSQLRRIDSRRNAVEGELNELLEAGQVDDLDTFRIRAAQNRDATRLRSERSELQARLQATLRNVEDHQTPEPTDEEISLARAEKEDAEELLRQSLEEIGALRSEIRRLEGARSPAERALRRQTLLSGLQQAVEEWRELQAARWLLDRGRSRGEAERAPAVLKRASRSFHRMTGGRYPRIVAAEGGTDMEVVADDARQRVPVHHLSRGTLGQLYLALRLALLEELALSSVALPMVMDDPLVNFDRERLGRALEAMAHTSEHCQIILLTCHESTTRLAEEAGADQIIPLPADHFGNKEEMNQ